MRLARTRVLARVFRRLTDLDACVLRPREHGWLHGTLTLRVGDGVTPGGHPLDAIEVVHVYHERGGLVFRGPPPSVWRRERVGHVPALGELLIELDTTTLYVGDGHTLGGVRVWPPLSSPHERTQ